MFILTIESSLTLLGEIRYLYVLRKALLYCTPPSGQWPGRNRGMEQGRVYIGCWHEALKGGNF